MRTPAERESVRSVLTPGFLLTLLAIAASFVVFGLILRSNRNNHEMLSLIATGSALIGVLLTVYGRVAAGKSRARREPL
jgi:hypothetical protein